MADYKILLTTSGIGSRLGDLTKYTNKSLIRIGRKPAISYIVESYPDEIPIVVTLGHFGNHVKDFLILTYPNKKFEFVHVDKYEGVGSSLLYSILCAKNNLQCPFIFHASDTVITKFDLNLNFNWLMGSKGSESSQYRSFDVQTNKVVRVNEKGQLHYDFNYVGVCGIKDYELFWNTANLIYEKDNTDLSLSDCHVIQIMLENTSFSYKETSSWMDIGNTDSLSRARQQCEDQFHILDKENESIFLFDNFVIKFFYDVKTCKNRVLRTQYLEGIVPKVIGFTDNFYKYEKANGDVLSEVVDTIKFEKLLEYCSKNLWIKKSSKDFKKICKSFYKDKTIQRIEESLKKHNINDEVDTINGIQIPKTMDVIESIDYEWLCDNTPTQFHGDFILDNIIYSNNYFTLIDWRQDFGGIIEYGDQYYDLAKLNHSLTFSHDIVNKNLFFIKNKNGHIFCDILRSNLLCECQKILNKFILNNDLNQSKINILTSLIWLNMSPLHEYPISLFLYYFGKYNLYINLKSNYNNQ
jgi:choline kinase/aminoglycoside phosphotransferase